MLRCRFIGRGRTAAPFGATTSRTRGQPRRGFPPPLFPLHPATALDTLPGANLAISLGKGSSSRNRLANRRNSSSPARAQSSPLNQQKGILPPCSLFRVKKHEYNLGNSPYVAAFVRFRYLLPALAQFRNQRPPPIDPNGNKYQTPSLRYRTAFAYLII